MPQLSAAVVASPRLATPPSGHAAGTPERPEQGDLERFGTMAEKRRRAMQASVLTPGSALPVGFSVDWELPVPSDDRV